MIGTFLKKIGILNYGKNEICYILILLQWHFILMNTSIRLLLQGLINFMMIRQNFKVTVQTKVIQPIFHAFTEQSKQTQQS